MELILIDQTKLKIMLTAPDMLRYELAPEKLEGMSCTDQHTRDAFRHIFDDAEAQIGFHTSGEKLLVQMFTSKCGGCEIFVTRLGSEAASLSFSSEKAPSICADPLDDLSLSPGEEALIRRVMAQESLDETEDAWEEGSTLMADLGRETHGSLDEEKRRFAEETILRRVFLTVTSLDILIAVCARLHRMGHTGVSRAYINEERTPATYHLYLEVPDGVFYTLPEEYAFLKEYGEVSRNKHMRMYLSEHGRMLCGDQAIETLGVL